MERHYVRPDDTRRCYVTPQPREHRIFHAQKKIATQRCSVACLNTPLDKLVDSFPLPAVAPPIGDTSLTHVMRLAALSTTLPTPTTMGQ
jgi:hypothetical protein